MKNSYEIQRDSTQKTLRVLSVSPSREDQTCLRRIFSTPGWASYTLYKWNLATCRTVESAITTLQNNSVPIVLCEADLRSGTWRDMLEASRSLSSPPLLIVTSRLADNYLWAEALNLGAYDVLAKPFDEHEVVRIVSLAVMHWRDRAKISSEPAKAMSATG